MSERLSQHIDNTIVQNSKYLSVCRALTELAIAKQLKKAVFSKPSDLSGGLLKVVLTPKFISGKIMLQAESFRSDNKVMHNNFSLDAKATVRTVSEICALAEKFLQVNVIGTNADAELRCSKSGKITVSGLSKLTGSIADGIVNGIANKKSVGGIAGETVRIDENNRKKVYILDGSEPFLRLLGISDATGRIYDKKQPKFRQINRFLEHIKDIYKYLPADGELFVLDLCCGKSYLSFAVYHYLANILGRSVDMRGVDLKADVIAYCSDVAKKLGFDGLEFSVGDINDYAVTKHPNLVISLHACDIATDIVIDKAIALAADVILSTPCCHHELNHKLDCEPLGFIAKYSMLRQKLCDAATDSLRLMRLEANGYSVDALELIDPDDTPKNILLRGIRKRGFDRSSARAQSLREEYEKTYKFLYGKNAD